MKPDPPFPRSNPAMEAPAAELPGEAQRESEWIERAQGGDAEAFRALVDLHRDRAYGLALRIVRAPADAEEVAQDAFVRVWRALPRFRGESAFGTWLYRIVARVAFDRAARLKTRRNRETSLEGPEGPEPVAPGGSDDGGPRRKLERLMGRLSGVQRTVVTLFYYRDHSVEDVARLLGLPENTVKTHLSRARGALRAAWIEEEGETP